MARKAAKVTKAETTTVVTPGDIRAEIARHRVPIQLIATRLGCQREVLSRRLAEKRGYGITPELGQRILHEVLSIVGTRTGKTSYKPRGLSGRHSGSKARVKARTKVRV